MLHDVCVDDGDDCFEQFFVEQYPRLVAIGLAWTNDRDAAADHAQETLARALSEWERVRRLDAPGGWAARVMMNLLVDRHRRWTRQERAVSGRRPIAEVSPVGITDDVWRSAVRSLPARQRAAIVLYYVVDLSIDEVAEVMQVAPGTVKATLSQARATLKEIVSEEVTS